MATMALFHDFTTISTNVGFQGRCQYALTVAAVNVVAEANNTANHQQRVNYAKTVINGTASILPVALAVLTNASIAAEAVASTTPDYAIPDSDIQFAVNSLFNALAGVTT
jgi:hypothetical protein